MNVPGICNMKVYGGEIEVQGEIDKSTIVMKDVHMCVSESTSFTT